MEKRVSGPHVMAGPVYEGVESSHRCNVLPGKQETIAQVSGPVYPVSSSHKYGGEGSDPSTNVGTGMMGPVYNVLHNHHFREVIMSRILFVLTLGKNGPFLIDYFQCSDVE